MSRRRAARGYSAGSKVRLIELMQYRAFFGGVALAVEAVPEVGVAVGAADLGTHHAVGAVLDVADRAGIASSNDGHPQCESNFVTLSNSWAPQARQRYTPLVLVSTYSPVNAVSVPACRSTRNSAGDSRTRHSSSVVGIV